MFFASHRFFLAITGLALLSGCVAQPAQQNAPNIPHALPVQSTELSVPKHGDFGHYTFALTWQPGFCSGPNGKSCTDSQPLTPLIGLHGLWASRPSDLIQAKLPVTTWWQKGCSVYNASTTAATPQLDTNLSATLASVMPHTRTPLWVHEYQKHASCFGMQATQFFTTAATLRNRFVALPSAQALINSAGHEIEKTTLNQLIERDTGTLPERAVQFQCNKTAQGQSILSQIWFTLKTDSLSKFPRAEAFIKNAHEQDNCPARFLIPQWSAQ
ncbi:MAG: ribonuclease I [Acetobacter orientalis]|uniref:ribonuclease T2 family protein n=1 Tax=Acetobacter orientalis TaxID=146474 RepID=UPI0039ED8A42